MDSFVAYSVSFSELKNSLCVRSTLLPGSWWLQRVTVFGIVDGLSTKSLKTTGLTDESVVQSLAIGFKQRTSPIA